MANQDKVPTILHFMSKDPAVPLRFVPPETPPPFEARSLLLKQIDTAHLDERAGHVMSLFSFAHDNWEKNKERWIERAERPLEDLSPDGPRHEVGTEDRQNRRYSGDCFLSSTRYYTVCRSADGNDGGTMEREFAAYHSPFDKGIMEIDDLTNGTLEPDRPTAVLLTIPPFTATQYEWLHESARQWATTAVLLPVSITEVSFRRLIDLRVSRVAAWFTRNLTRLRWLNHEDAETLAFPRKEPLNRFADLLPSLLVQDMGGGNGPTRIAGQWLRSLGADALVFPSARSDSFVEVRDGQFSDFYGWNLVDYRDSHPVRMQSIDMTASWLGRISGEIDEEPQAMYADVGWQSVEQGSGKGSWAVQNLEQVQEAHRLFLGAMHLYAWAWDEASADQMRLLTSVLGVLDRAEVLWQRSGVFLGALLGDEDARRAHVKAVSAALPTDQAHLLDLPETFRRMDARVASWAGGIDASPP